MVAPCLDAAQNTELIGKDDYRLMLLHYFFRLASENISCHQLLKVVNMAGFFSPTFKLKQRKAGRWREEK